MKRLLSILASVGLVATASTAAVSCSSTPGSKKNLQFLTVRPAFVSAEPYGEQDKDKLDVYYITSISVDGIGLDKLTKDDFAHIQIIGDSENSIKTPVEIDLNDTTIAPNDTQLIIGIKGLGIEEPPVGKDPDNYTVSLINEKDGLNLTVSFQIQAHSNDA